MTHTVLTGILLAGLVTACPGSPEGPRVLPRDPDRPYVITAIDYHFHDAHPTPRLSREREVVFSNQGSNVHNVTILGTGYVRDLQPGDRISLGKIGSILSTPGRHRFVCSYHLDRDMIGVIVIAR